MYCPKCSQQQPSDEMRFCSRCGFPLSGVAMLVEKDGIIPELTGTSGHNVFSPRKKVMTESAIFTGIAWTLALIDTAAFDAGGQVEMLAKVAALLFFCLGLIGLLRFLYGFLFVKDMPVQPAQTSFPRMNSRDALADASRRGALPAQKDLPATDYTRRANTKEMAHQPSVTENTTRLLDESTTDRND